jgi:hypothetical protein
MRKSIAVVSGVAVAALVGLGAAPAAAAPPSCSWGELTAYAIHEVEGWDQGRHSADPSGDGPGPEDRVGLANVTGKGDLAGTCVLIDSLLRP